MTTKNVSFEMQRGVTVGASTGPSSSEQATELKSFITQQGFFNQIPYPASTIAFARGKGK